MKLLILYMGNPKNAKELEESKGIKYANPNNMFSQVHIIIPNSTAFSEAHNPLKLKDSTYVYFFRQRDYLSSLVFLKSLNQAIRIIKQQKIDIIRAYNPHFCGLLGVLASRWAGIPCIVSIHSDLRTLFKISGVKYLFRSKLLTEAIERFCLKKAKLVLNQAEHMREYLSEKYRIAPEKFSPIKIMVDRPQDISWNPDNRHFTLIFVGRLDEQKNPLSLLKAFQLAKAQVPQLRLWLIGDGELCLTLKDFVNSCTLKDITFLGRLEQNMVFKLLAQAHVFVHPGAKGEGFSNTILEAQSMGLPALVTDEHSNITQLQDYVLTYRYDNPLDAATKIVNLFKDKGLYSLYSRKSLDFIKEYMSDDPLSIEQNIYNKAAKMHTLPWPL